MLIIQASKTVRSLPIEGFPDKAKRSAKGALHIAPGVTKEITEDELKVIEELHPEVFKKLRVIYLAREKSVDETQQDSEVDEAQQEFE